MRKLASIGTLLGVLLFAVTAVPAESDVSALVAKLKSPDQAARLEAIDHLGRMGERAAQAVPALTELLKDDAAAVRAHAAESLGEIGAAAKSAAPALVALITDPDVAVRRESIEAVRKIQPGPEVVVPLAVKLLEEAEPSVRIRALDALAEEGKAAVPGLIEALKKNERAAYWACLVLAEIGPDAGAAVPALIEALDYPDPGVRREVILALASIGEASAPATAALAKALDDEINQVPATYALGKIGQVPEVVEKQIQKNAQSDDAILSTVSTWALARLHPDDKDLLRKAVRQLAEGLKRPDPRQRAAAAQALVELDPDPEIARPILKNVVQNAPPEVQDAALDAIAGLGEKVLPRVIDMLKVAEARPRAAAIVARIGPPAKPAVPALIEALGDDRAETRSEVLFALAAIGPDAKAAVPAVAKAINDPDMNVSYAACYALGKVGPAALAAKKELQENLAAADPFLRMASAWALARIHPECPETAPKSVPILVKALAEPDVVTRLEAIESLCCLKALAKEAVPALKEALQDENPAVREAAAKALEAVGN